MKTITKHRLLILAVCFLGFVIPSTTLAQNNNNAIGLRGRYSGGITFKHALGGASAFEGILSTRYRRLTVTGLNEIHKTAFNTPNLNWYYGAGGHIGFYEGKYYIGPDNKVYQGQVTTLGIDGILGLEYQIPDIPFVVSLDMKPFFDLLAPGPSFGTQGIA
ncbi:MAG: hypothetical protein ACI81S_002273 [Sphingobacteriales bacterium]|jgi:hypothetical protein